MWVPPVRAFLTDPSALVRCLRFGCPSPAVRSSVARSSPRGSVGPFVSLPPFGLFISEFALVRAGFTAGRVWLMGAVLALLVVAFIALVTHLNRMLYGTPPKSTSVGEHTPWALAPIGLCVVILVILGLALPAPVSRLLNKVVEIAAP